ncbi:MAG: ATP-dependent DNA helicase [Gammaproteobacteria bacterium]|nr:ATP-dependent DNA helicase [Gammaproteobacteria bacterium]
MKASEFLGEQGVFSSHVEGYKVRQSQLALSDAIEAAIQNNTVLVAEAGTGIGKTFAYLVPAINSGKKVIISTGTKHLQDQLFRTDIPRVLKALDVPIKTALLKGRANYLCLHRLQIAPHLGFMNKITQSQLTEIGRWAGTTVAGDISELSSIQEDAYVWPMVTSTADNCIGTECDHWNDCFIVKARKKAQEAELLVINHHLLLADMTLKEEGFAELLPGADAFVIDEAHQLHETASRYFGDTLSSRQLILLARDSIAEQVNDAPDMTEIRECADQLEKATQDVRIALGDSGVKQAWAAIKYKPALVNCLAALITALSDLSAILELASERSRALDQCYQRCLILSQRAELFKNDNELADAANAILWYETYSKSFMLHSTPIEVSSLFRKYTNNFSAAWIFTSATLQVNKKFNHFSDALGLEAFESGSWLSPFDYPQQSLLYLPEDLPEPSDYSYTHKLLEKVLPVLMACHGGAFLLFTSYRAMNEAKDFLQDKLDYPILIQGDLPKHQLLARFRKKGDAILLGTSSFWEGVDVRGRALSCVVIDKLPFASPGDPVMQARIDAIKNNGGQPFMEYQIPRAVIALNQGVGRLIRDVNDHGVVVIGDPRLSTKAYGRVFKNGLPPMPTTTQISDVEKFFEAKKPEAQDECETAGA